MRKSGGERGGAEEWEMSYEIEVVGRVVVMMRCLGVVGG